MVVATIYPLNAFFCYNLHIMNELIRVEEITEKTMTSLELAELSWRRHDVLKKSIERMWEDLKAMDKPPVVEYEYDTWYNNIKWIAYNLTIYQCELLALALDWIARIKVLDKLEELRKVKPMTIEQLLEYNTQVVKQLREENLQLTTKAEENKPLVDFANTIANSSDAILIREFTKLINIEWIDIWEKRLFKWFRDNGYLSSKNEPYQTVKKYFTVIERPVVTIKGTLLSTTTKINGFWQVYFLEKLRKEYIK